MMPVSMSPRVQATRVLLTILVLATAIVVPGAGWAQEATPDRNSRIKTDEAGTNGVERLVDDQPMLLDDFGRIPLLRVTFAPGAELPPTFEVPEQDDPIPFFMEDLLILVETGDFAFDVDGETVTAAEGERIEIDANAAAGLSIRNDGEAEGSILVLRTAFDAPEWAPVGGAALNEVAPEGVGFEQIFDELDPTTRLMEIRFSLDRVTLQPGDEIESVDFGGSTETLSIQIALESDPLTPDSEIDYGPGIDTSVRSIGTDPAVFLVGRVAETE